MATLKDHIRAVVKTRTTPSEASNASSIGSTLIEVSGPDYVASSDGYVNAYFHVASAPGAFGVLTNHGAQISSTQLASAASVNLQATLPVSKGQAINVYQTGFEKVKLYFIKTIGGGYKRYLSSLSRSRFGGAPWLRLKTTSETLPRLAAGLPLRRQGGFLSRPLSTRVMKRGDTKPLLQSASSLSNLSTQTSVTGISKTRLHTPILAGQLSASTQGRATCPVTRAMQSRTTLGAQADKPRMQVPLRSTSFLLSVASNNARMEVAA